MKKLLLFVTLLSFGILTYSQPAKEKLIPVTTKSKSGLSLYNQGMKYFNDVHLDKAIEAFNEALKQDPDFFMAIISWHYITFESWTLITLTGILMLQ